MTKSNEHLNNNLQKNILIRVSNEGNSENIKNYTGYTFSQMVAECRALKKENEDLKKKNKDLKKELTTIRNPKDKFSTLEENDLHEASLVFEGATRLQQKQIRGLLAKENTNAQKNPLNKKLDDTIKAPRIKRKRNNHAISGASVNIATVSPEKGQRNHAIYDEKFKITQINNSLRIGKNKGGEEDFCIRKCPVPVKEFKQERVINGQNVNSAKSSKTSEDRTKAKAKSFMSFRELVRKVEGTHKSSVSSKRVRWGNNSIKEFYKDEPIIGPDNASEAMEKFIASALDLVTTKAVTEAVREQLDTERRMAVTNSLSSQTWSLRTPQEAGHMTRR